MVWRDIPVGMMQNDEILNALLAIWKTQHRNTLRNAGPPEGEYEAGFEAGLDAVAQAAGLADAFDSEKARYRLKVKRQQELRPGMIEPFFTVVNG